jgi:hypothetical protein
VSSARQWAAQRRLLVAAATLQRVRLAHQVQTLRATFHPAHAGAALALALAATWAWRGATPRRVLRVWRSLRAWLHQSVPH